MKLRSEMLNRFETTDYIIDDDPPLILHIGERNDSIRALFASFSVETGAFVTAWNPGGEVALIDDNYARQADLLTEIEVLRLNYFVGQGVHPDGDWQEDSYLILGISQEDADRIGRLFGQAAYVWLSNSGVPELRFLSD
ncbi:MAG: hypothetical protein ACI9B8_002627 [Sulfitobacter sp.]|jgi:hypothetical protein